MIFTVRPADMVALVPVQGIRSNLCEPFKKSLLVNVVLRDWFTEMYTDGGEFTEGFCQMLHTARP